MVEAAKMADGPCTILSDYHGMVRDAQQGNTPETCKAVWDELYAATAGNDATFEWRRRDQPPSSRLAHQLLPLMPQRGGENYLFALNSPSVLSRSVRLTGVTKCPSHPASLDSFRSPSCPHPVRAMMIISFSHFPLTPGSGASLRTR